jgi:20S proteasome alpha/beta subunit
MDANIPSRGSRLRETRYDKLPKPIFGACNPVTVCIATLFSWNYAPRGEPTKYGTAALTASDRMITAGNVVYEPRQQKISFMTPHTIVLVAGNMVLHSEALRATQNQIRGRPDTSPSNIALIYGRAIQAIKQREAEGLFLAPLGLNTDTFMGQQKDMSDSFVRRVTDQLQDYEGSDVEALVVGVSTVIAPPGMETDHAQIYSINYRGQVRTYDDIGFAAIGIGAVHAESRLMQAGYVKGVDFAHALAMIYGAKKSAEIAPGVGKATDFQLITKTGVERLQPILENKIAELYQDYENKRNGLAINAVTQLQSFITGTDNSELTKPNDDRAKETREDVQTNGGAGAPAAETARKDETGKTVQ